MGESFRIDRERVQLLMQFQGLETYEQLADLAGLHPNTITRALKGQAWSSETASKMAGALKCNPIDLLVAEGYSDPKLLALVNP